MPLMLTLSPETDEWLREDEQDFTESVAAVREGLADLEAWDRGILLEDHRVQLEADYRQEDAALFPVGAA